MKDKQKKIYVLEFQVENCDAELYFNDIPIILRGPDHGRFFKAPANHYLIDGVNEMAIIINPGETPGIAISGSFQERRRASAEGAFSIAKLMVYPYGAIAGGPSGQEIMRVEWIADDNREYAFPAVIAVQQDLGTAFGKWEWEDLDQIELNDSAKAEIADFLDALRISLEAGNPEPFIETSRPRLESAERAYGLRPGERADLIREVTKMDASKSWWGMEPLDTEQFDFRMAAKGRLVECIGKDWKPVLKEKPDPEGGVSTYSMFLGKSNGTWHIIL